jgi:hypothetical protein
LKKNLDNLESLIAALGGPGPSQNPSVGIKPDPKKVSIFSARPRLPFHGSVSEEETGHAPISVRSYKRLPKANLEYSRPKRPISIKSIKGISTTNPTKSMKHVGVFRRQGSGLSQNRPPSPSFAIRSNFVKLPSIEFSSLAHEAKRPERPSTGISAEVFDNESPTMRRDSDFSPPLGSVVSPYRDNKADSSQELASHSFPALPHRDQPQDCGQRAPKINPAHYIESHRESSLDSEEKEKEGGGSIRVSDPSKVQDQASKNHPSPSTMSRFLALKENILGESKSSQLAKENSQAQEGDSKLSNIDAGRIPLGLPQDEKGRIGATKVPSLKSIKEEPQGRVSYTSKHSEIPKPLNLAERLNKLIDKKKQVERQSYRHFNREADFMDLKPYERRSYRGPRENYDPRAGIKEDLLARQARNNTNPVSTNRKSSHEQSQSIDSLKKESDINSSSVKVTCSAGEAKLMSKGDSLAEGAEDQEVPIRDELIFIESSPVISLQRTSRISIRGPNGSEEGKITLTAQKCEQDDTVAPKIGDSTEALNQEEQKGAYPFPRREKPTGITPGGDLDFKARQKFKPSIFATKKLEAPPQTESSANLKEVRRQQAEAFYADLENVDLRRPSAELEESSASQKSFEQ